MRTPCKAFALLLLILSTGMTIAAQSPTPIQGDLNQDSRVDQDDLLILRAQWHEEYETTPIHTPSATLTPTGTTIPSETPTDTPTPTQSPSQTPTSAGTPSVTPTPTNPLTPPPTPAESFTPTLTPSPTVTRVDTPGATATSTPTPSGTPVEADTPTHTPTPLVTATETSTPTRTPSPAATDTPGPSPTETPTATPPGVTPLPTFIADLPGGATIEFVLIPAGSFMMGGATDEGWNDYEDHERPVHPVSIDYDFYIGRYEVTQAQWQVVMENNPSSHIACGSDCPVEQVSWDDCQSYIVELNQLGQGTFRLPTEAEWEYACRAGTTTRFFFGDSTCDSIGCASCELDAYAWWCGNDGASGSKTVGLLLPNPFGLYDILGNIEEWCEDDWHGSYEDAPNDGSAWTDSPRGANRVLRGGFWNYQARFYRSASREYSPPGTIYQGNGVRLVREAP